MLPGGHKQLAIRESRLRSMERMWSERGRRRLLSSRFEDGGSLSERSILSTRCCLLHPLPSRNLWRHGQRQDRAGGMHPVRRTQILWRQRDDNILDVKLRKWIYMCGRIESLRATSVPRWRSVSERTVLYHERGRSVRLWTWNIQPRYGQNELQQLPCRPTLQRERPRSAYRVPSWCMVPCSVCICRQCRARLPSRHFRRRCQHRN